MAYSINTHTIPGCHDYEAAVRLYDKAKQWRCNPKHGEERKLRDSSRTNMGVRLGSNKEVIFRLYNTDVVVWFPDNSIAITPYSTISTNAFVSNFAPVGFWPYFTASPGGLISVRDITYKVVKNHWGDYNDHDRRIYRLSDSGGRFAKVANEEEAWRPVDGTLPIVVPKVDAKKARVATKKYQLKEFEGFLRAMSHIAMPNKAEYQIRHFGGNQPKSGVNEPWYFDLARGLRQTRYTMGNLATSMLDQKNWIAYLAAPDLYPETGVRGWGGNYSEYTIERHIANILRHVRASIYIVEDVVEETEVEYLTSYDQIKRVAATCALYGL